MIKLILSLVLLCSCGQEENQRTLVASADRTSTFNNAMYESAWIARCNDANQNITLEVFNGNFKVTEFTATTYDDCNARKFDTAISTSYLYENIKPSKEQTYEGVIYLAVKNANQEIARIKFSTNMGYAQYEVESSNDSGFPLQGDFISSLVFQVSVKDPLRRENIKLELN